MSENTNLNNSPELEESIAEKPADNLKPAANAKPQSGKDEKSDKKALEEAKINRFKEENARLDRFYDGYYDDVLPNDEGETYRKVLDNDVKKKLALIIGGGIVLIIFSVIVLLRS